MGHPKVHGNAEAYRDLVLMAFKKRHKPNFLQGLHLGFKVM